MKKTICVLVSFNPDPGRIMSALESIRKNGVDIVIVDNGSSNGWVQGNLGAVTLIKEEENIGVAQAQNIGIKKAMELGADYIWLSDQDTIYPDEYISVIVSGFFDEKGETRKNIGAIGSSFYDENRGALQPVVRFSPFLKKFMPCPGLNRVSHMIASGMVIPVDVLKSVGLKQGDLFIDWVDMEWCWRTENIKGFQLYVCGDVVLNHQLGYKNKKLFGKKLILRNHFRHYFMIRNAVALALYSKSLRWNQRLSLITRSIAWSVVFPCLTDGERVKNMKSVFWGWVHGLSNRLGGFYSK